MSLLQVSARKLLKSDSRVDGEVCDGIEATQANIDADKAGFEVTRADIHASKAGLEVIKQAMECFCSQISAKY